MPEPENAPPLRVIELRLESEPSSANSTLGVLSIDGVPFCDTLEDVVREKVGVPVQQWKIGGRTAIPQGRYRVHIGSSPTFSPKLAATKNPVLIAIREAFGTDCFPRLEAVPGFQGILMHWGNSAIHTHGCLLVGRRLSGTPDFISSSALTWSNLVRVLYPQRECPIWITIVRRFPVEESKKEERAGRKAQAAPVTPSTGGVAVNPPKTPITTGSNGIAAATLPNLCNMPGPSVAPLPNIGRSGLRPQGYSRTVEILGCAVAIRGATFGSVGDVAAKGTGGGVVSANTEGPCSFIAPGSLNVFIEGKNVHVLSDVVTNNGGPTGTPANSATMAGVVQEPLTVAPDEPDQSVCESTVPPAPAGVMGTCDYYPFRVNNFEKRHSGCVHVVPGYYLDYGHKYCLRFGNELEPKLSEKGQAWLRRTRLLLQVYLEDELQRDPSIELDPAALKLAAFRTHPRAYWDAGLYNVPLWDKVRIGMTPDLGEWRDPLTREQAYDVIGRHALEYQHAAMSVVQDIRDAIRSAFE